MVLTMSCAGKLTSPYPESGGLNLGSTSWYISTWDTLCKESNATKLIHSILPVHPPPITPHSILPVDNGRLWGVIYDWCTSVNVFFYDYFSRKTSSAGLIPHPSTFYWFCASSIQKIPAAFARSSVDPLEHLTTLHVLI